MAKTTSAPGPQLKLDRRARTASSAAPPRPSARRAAISPARRSRVGLVLALVGLIVVGLAVVGIVRRGARPAVEPVAPVVTIAATERCKVPLALDPADASVRIDQLPSVGDDLHFDNGSPHVLHATAPGRIARGFTFNAKPGLELSVHLGRTLPLPSPADGEPAPGEPAPGYPAKPPSRDELNRAFAKLVRYDRCLALLANEGKGAQRGGHPDIPSSSEMRGCVQLMDEASVLPPEMSSLHRAAGAYLQAAHVGKKPPALGKLLAAFRSEFLAVRTEWQVAELSRQGADEGQTAAWHTRRVALAAQAWLRRGGARESRAELNTAHQAFLEFNHNSPLRFPGAEAFAKSAQELLSLAGGQGGAKPDRAAAFAACQRLLTAFNALVVD